MFLTLQCGKSLLVTVDYDGLLRRGSTALASKMILIMETLHMKLQMAITIKPEILCKFEKKSINQSLLKAVHYHFTV